MCADKSQAAERSDSRSINRQRTEERILDAALVEFSTNGYKGARIDLIAARAGMSKPNLLYYFRTKKSIYESVLNRLLDDWLEPLVQLDVDGDPAEQLMGYIDAKLEASRTQPEASRLYATEIINGAPMVQEFLKVDLTRLVSRKSRVLRKWMREGRMRNINPQHYLYAIWSTTQHYSDFDAQISLLHGTENRDWKSIRASLKTLLVDSVIIE